MKPSPVSATSQIHPAGAMPVKEYLVAVLGFNSTDRIVLQSIFGLAARRIPTFKQHSPASGRPPDIYLVDADDQQAVDMLMDVNAARETRSLLIGTDSNGTGWPILARPLQWTRLFRAFDLAVSQAGIERTSSLAPATTAAAAGTQLVSLNESSSARAVSTLNAELPVTVLRAI
jgi:two-component system, cell cycle response regulator